jgi:hypothetical protein
MEASGDFVRTIAADLPQIEDLYTKGQSTLPRSNSYLVGIAGMGIKPMAIGPSRNGRE